MILTINFPKDNTYTSFRYPGGEVQVRLYREFVDLVKHPKVEEVHIYARITNGEIVELAQLINAIRGATSADIKLILPYLPYGRADRRFVLGDTLGLQVFGQLLNTLAGVDIITLDVHSDQAAKYIRHFTNVSPKPIIDEVISRCDGSAIYGNPVLTTAVLLPDKGSLRYGYPTNLICEKVRDPETGKLHGFTVPSPNKFTGADNILIIDDICDGGRTFVGIAQELRKQGVTQDLFLYVTHGIFSNGLDSLSIYKHVFTTDSFSDLDGIWPNLTIIRCAETILNGVKQTTAGR